MAFQKTQLGNPGLANWQKQCDFNKDLNWPYIKPSLKTSLCPVLSYWRINSHNIKVWKHIKNAPCSCRCRWCRSTSAGNTPPASVWVGLGSGGIGWTLSHGASACGTAPFPNTAAGWWQKRSQRCWRTSKLERTGQWHTDES